MRIQSVKKRSPTLPIKRLQEVVEARFRLDALCQERFVTAATMQTLLCSTTNAGVLALCKLFDSCFERCPTIGLVGTFRRDVPKRPELQGFLLRLESQSNGIEVIAFPDCVGRLLDKRVPRGVAGRHNHRSNGVQLH